MEQIDPREWGRQQAAASPVWTEEKWQRIATLLDITWLPDRQRPSTFDDMEEAA